MDTLPKKPCSRHLWKVLNFLAPFAASSSLFVLAAFSVYIFANDSNHTGHDPWMLSAIFLPTLAIGVAALFCRRLSAWLIAAICIGLGGMLFLFLIDCYDIMLQYDRWLQRGMPSFLKPSG